MVGTTQSADFPTTSNAFQTVKGALDAAFLTKINKDGDLVYSTFISGSFADRGRGIATILDVYLTGTAASGDFPTTPGAFQRDRRGTWDIFVARFSLGLANLAVTISVSPKHVSVGNELTYTITVSNSGPDPATRVQLLDTLPQDTILVSATPGQGSCARSTGAVTCILGDLAAGSSTTVMIVVTSTTAGTITNTVTVTGNENDPVTANNTAQQRTDVTLPYAVKFICGKSAGDVTAPGTYVTAINVHNPTDKAIRFSKKFAIPLSGEKSGPVSPFFEAKLQPDHALEIDCPDILNRIQTRAQFVKGFVIIESAVQLDVVAVYTAAGATGKVETLFVERVLPLHREVKPVHLADLLPVKPLPGPGPTGFCKRDSGGRLLVSVRNQGGATASASMTKVEFFPGGSYELPTPPVPTERTIELPGLEVPAICFKPECRFRITVDSNHDVSESNEANNTADGTCVG